MDLPQQNLELFVVLPFLPPSANHIYVTRRGSKQRFLSKVAETFKRQTVALVGSTCQHKIARLNPAGVYRTWYVFYFHEDELLNKTFGKGTKQDARSRYKKMDVENRVKLVADSFAEAIGIDDSHFFENGNSKLSCSLMGGTPQLHVYLAEADLRRFGL